MPPDGYGGTERVVFELVSELHRRGHEVTTFASGDSEVPGRLVEIIPEALRPAGHGGDVSGFMLATILQALDRQDEFDLVHSHLEWYSIALQRAIRTPFVADVPRPARPAVVARRCWPTGPRVWSRSASRRRRPTPRCRGPIVHNGLTLAGAPFERRRSDDLVFVGRVTPEKGIVEAIEIAQLADRPLKIAAKIGPTPKEQEFNEAGLPARAQGGRRADRVPRRAVRRGPRRACSRRATPSLMPGSWPEPFGLVAIEALACGAPVLAKRVGGLDEIIRDGVDGFFGDDVTQLAFLVERVAELDRAAIRASVIDRFSATRMADGYEALYARMLGLEGAETPGNVVDLVRPGATTG